MPTYKTIAEWIESEIGRRGLTQRGLAELADVHWTSLSAVIRGKRDATAELVIKLAQAFDSSPDELVQLLALAGIWKKPMFKGVLGADDWWIGEAKRIARGAPKRAIEMGITAFGTAIKNDSKYWKE